MSSPETKESSWIMPRLAAVITAGALMIVGTGGYADGLLRVKQAQVLDRKGKTVEATDNTLTGLAEGVVGAFTLLCGGILGTNLPPRRNRNSVT